MQKLIISVWVEPTVVFAGIKPAFVAECFFSFSFFTADRVIDFSTYGVFAVSGCSKSK